MRILRILTKSESRYRIGSHFLHRIEHSRLQVDKQLMKYGFKPNSYSSMFYTTSLFMLFTFGVGFFYAQHILTVHDNVLMAIKTNSPIEIVSPAYHAKLMQFVHDIKLNIYYFDLGMGGPTLDHFTAHHQALIRIQQHKNFKKNRNNKMDFLNIGEVVQYPFPNIQKQLQQDQSQ